MIIRLPGADFSADNIGNIPLIRELSPEVVEILSHYTRELSENQKFAFQDFYDGLKSNGIWAKIENLFIPALADDVDEAFYPIKGSGVTGTYTKAYSLKNHGLFTIGGDDGLDRGTPATASASGSLMNFHIASYLSYAIANDSNEAIVNSVYSSAANARITKFGKLGYLRGGTGDKSWGATEPSLPVDGSSMFVGVSSGTDEKFYIGNGKKLGGTYEPYDVDTTFTNAKLYIGSNVNNASRNNAANALISTGSAMAEDMMIKYNQLVDALMESLL